MPNTPNIQLDIRLGGSADPGWVNVSASNGQAYGYLYTGGDDGHGGLVQTVQPNGQGRDTAQIQLTADNRYQISGCTFRDDPFNQLSWNGSGRAGTLVDANTSVETAKYTVNVADTANGNCNIPCDPLVTNKQPT